MKEVYDAAVEIALKLQSKGFTTYFAGGWVRDYLMDHPSDDIDIATSASVEEIQMLFEKTIPVGVAFGIVIVVHKKHQFEVATFRKEGDYQDGRRPSFVETATPKEDALRRDFSINGMFYDPVKKELIDYVNGQTAIQKKLIEAIGNPDKRFYEDRLRMMRAIRYSARFEFQIEPQTLRAIEEHAHLLFPSVAIERVVNEFEKMCRFAHFDQSILALYDVGLLQTIFPSLKDESRNKIEQAVHPFPSFPEKTPLILYLLQLFPQYTLAEQIDIAFDLKLSRDDRRWIESYHQILELSHKKKAEDYAWARAYAEEKSSIILKVISLYQGEEDNDFLRQHQERQKNLALFIELFKNKRTLISAADLQSIGVSPGPKMGTLLEEGMRFAVNHHCQDRKKILEHLKNFMA